jgi:hypothetical protein
LRCERCIVEFGLFHFPLNAVCILLFYFLVGASVPAIHLRRGAALAAILLARTPAAISQRKFSGVRTGHPAGSGAFFVGPTPRHKPNRSTQAGTQEGGEAPIRDLIADFLPQKISCRAGCN